MNRRFGLALLCVVAAVSACSKSDQKFAPVDTTLADDGPTAAPSTPAQPQSALGTELKPTKNERQARQAIARDAYADAGDSEDYENGPAPYPARVTPPSGPTQAAPKGNPASWATTNDYPTRALREERAGTVSFRLAIGPDGRVMGCTIADSSGSPDLDDATCSNVTRRARFTPATDAEGNPTSGSYSNRIRWVIPTG